MASIRPRKDKQGSTTSYQIRVFRGKDEHGKQLTPYTLSWEPPPGKTERQIQKLLNEAAVAFENNCKLGYAVTDRQTFAHYSGYVLELKEHSGTKHRTIVRYRELLTRIIPEIGHLKLSEIRPQHLNTFYAKLAQPGERKDSQKAVATQRLIQLVKEGNYSRAKLAELAGVSAASVTAVTQGKKVILKTARSVAAALNCDMDTAFILTAENDQLSNKTILEHHRLIRTILNQAEREMIIPYNPASKASPPKQERTEANYFSSDDVVHIREALKLEPLKWQIAVNLLLLSGCRRGEILGLRWNKVLWESNQIHICNNLLYSKDRGIYEDSTKTYTSTRLIALPQEMMDFLRQYQDSYKEQAEQMGFALPNDGFLFTQEHSLKPMAPDSLTDYCNRFSKKYTLPHINPHAFRHTHISLLVLNGVDIVTASKRAGHATVSTTANIYSHLMDKADESASEVFANAVLRDKKRG